jgi:hypothetical protein
MSGTSPGHNSASGGMTPSREAELQKKREEAERKARRGEIDPTHEFTIQVYTVLHILTKLFYNGQSTLL